MRNESTVQPRRLLMRVVTMLSAVVLVVGGCGGDDDGGGGGSVEGTYVHEEEGTIVLESGGDESLTQSGEPVPFTWEQDGDVVLLTMDGEVVAEATVEGEAMTFRAGDFSGDEPVTFQRED